MGFSHGITVYQGVGRVTKKFLYPDPRG